MNMNLAGFKLQQRLDNNSRRVSVAVQIIREDGRHSDKYLRRHNNVCVVVAEQVIVSAPAKFHPLGFLA